jgi:C-methyltransferase
MMTAKSELKSMFTEHWKYFAVSAACELRLFDKIFDGQNSLEKLVQKNYLDLRTVLNLLDFLSANSYLSELENNTYTLTEKGDLLREGNTEGLYHACLNWLGEHLIAWQNLKYSVESGKSAFEQIYQKSYFDFLDYNPDKLRNYHKAMYEYAIDDYKELPNLIDFSVHKSIMDVGGGYGAAISLIKEKNQITSCFLFDLDKVIEQVSNRNIERIGGNFFEKIPQHSEAIILSRVLHDWNNEKAELILKNCYNALPLYGTLYVIENCTDKIPTNLSLLSLNMTVMCQSFERSSTDYIKLCEAPGFIFQKDIPLNQLQSILIFNK